MVQKKKYTCRYFHRLILILIGYGLLTNCGSPYKTEGTKSNLSAIYNPISTQIHPVFKVYHNSDHTSLLMVKVFPSELLFNQANVEGEFLSKISVQAIAYEIEDDNAVFSDSITYNYTINQSNVGKRFLAQIPLKTEMGKRYQLRIVTRDLLRKNFNLKFVDVDKTSEYSEQNFNIIDQNNIPYFSNVISKGLVYKIQHRNLFISELFIDYYGAAAPVPKTTYVESEQSIFSSPDTSYIISYSPALHISFSYEGLYHFRIDTIKPEGLTIINLGPEFPKITDPIDLIEPLAYLTTDPEQNKLLVDENKKLTADNFWLEVAGSTNRAKELIRVFYNRVYFSNYYFTDSRPGWKTDRGMIYTIYGPPQSLKKTPNSETWIYYLKDPNNSINFVFNYRPTPFTLDNFVLDRSENYDWHWREAIGSWRKGKIFLVD